MALFSLKVKLEKLHIYIVRAAAHRVVVTIHADVGHAAIAWSVATAFTHQIAEGLREEGWSKHT